MKLTARDIPAFLKQPLARCKAVLIYGPDTGLISERVKEIAQAVVADVSDPFSVVEMAEDKLRADPALLRDELSSMGFFAASQKLIIIRSAGDRLTKIIEEAYQELDSDTFLIVAADELSARSSLRALFERNAAFAALPCYKDEGNVLRGVITQALESHGLRAEPDVIPYLMFHLGSDRRVTLSELEKLALYMGEEQLVTLETVMSLVGDNNDFTMDDLCTGVADGRMDVMESITQRLLREGAQPVSILRSLQRYFQKLYAIRAQMAEGTPLDQAVSQLRPPVFFKQVPVVKRHAYAWDISGILKAQQLLLMAETACKRGQLTPDLLCQHYLLRVTSLARQLGRLAA